MKKNKIPKVVAIATLWCFILAVTSIVDIKVNGNGYVFLFMTIAASSLGVPLSYEMWNYIK